MERRAWLLAVVLGALVAAPAAAFAGSRLAPADEYFGRAKMSPLEITNRIRDAERGRAAYAVLASTQAAIEDWTRRYPGDPWIPSREYRLSQLFARLHSAQGNAQASHCRAFLHAHFAGSSYAVATAKAPSPSASKAPRTSVAKAPSKKRHRFLGILF